MLIYKGKPIAEPGNVDFGSADISGICDGTVTGAIVELNDKRPVSLNTDVSHTVSAGEKYELVTSIVIPANSFYTVTMSPGYNSSKGTGVYISGSSSNYSASTNWAETTTSHSDNGVAVTKSGVTLNDAETLYVWAKWAGAGFNKLHVRGFYIPA